MSGSLKPTWALLGKLKKQKNNTPPQKKKQRKSSTNILYHLRVFGGEVILVFFSHDPDLTLGMKVSQEPFLVNGVEMTS